MVNKKEILGILTQIKPVASRLVEKISQLYPVPYYITTAVTFFRKNADSNMNFNQYFNILFT